MNGQTDTDVAPLARSVASSSSPGVPRQRVPRVQHADSRSDLVGHLRSCSDCCGRLIGADTWDWARQRGPMADGTPLDDRRLLQRARPRYPRSLDSNRATDMHRSPISPPRSCASTLLPPRAQTRTRLILNPPPSILRSLCRPTLATPRSALGHQELRVRTVSPARVIGLLAVGKVPNQMDQGLKLVVPLSRLTLQRRPGHRLRPPAGRNPRRNRCCMDEGRQTLRSDL